MREYVTLFDEEIRSRGAKTVLYMTWARRHQWERNAELGAVYESTGEAVGTIVVPVGVAWQRLMAEWPEVGLHDKDDSHPNFAGTFLAACVFYSVLFGRRVEGVDAGDLAGVERFGVGVAEVLRRMAWESVRSGA